VLDVYDEQPKDHWFRKIYCVNNGSQVCWNVMFFCVF